MVMGMVCIFLYFMLILILYAYPQNYIAWWYGSSSLTFEERPYQYLESLHSFSFPPMYTRIPPTPFATNIIPHIIIGGSVVAILTTVRWNLNVVFICFCLWLKLLSISYTFAGYFYFFENYMFSLFEYF